jgi:hypothetical protein
VAQQQQQRAMQQQQAAGVGMLVQIRKEKLMRMALVGARV